MKIQARPDGTAHPHDLDRAAVVAYIQGLGGIASQAGRVWMLLDAGAP